jgi:hypothetical protein
MYQVIKKHPPLVDQYAKKLINDKVVTQDEYKVHRVTYTHKIVSELCTCAGFISGGGVCFHINNWFPYHYYGVPLNYFHYF